MRRGWARQGWHVTHHASCGRRGGRRRCRHACRRRTQRVRVLLRTPVQRPARVAVPLCGHPALWHRRLPAFPSAPPSTGDQGGAAGKAGFSGQRGGCQACQPGAAAAAAAAARQRRGASPTASPPTTHLAPLPPLPSPSPCTFYLCPPCTLCAQEDDQDISDEGLDSLTVDELRTACRWASAAGRPGRLLPCRTRCDRGARRALSSPTPPRPAEAPLSARPAPAPPATAGHAACVRPLARAPPSTCGSSWPSGSTGA